MAGDAPRVAFDANIFFYAVDHKDTEKHRRCAGLLEAAMDAGVGCTPLQALGEFCYAAVRKKVLTRRQAAATANDWATFASRLVRAGVDLPTVKELMGHKTLLMTLRYSHLSPQHRRDAVQRLVRRSAATDTMLPLMRKRGFLDVRRDGAEARRA